jgi:hypothetical protein
MCPLLSASPETARRKRFAGSRAPKAPRTGSRVPESARRMPCAGSLAPEAARRKPCAGSRAPEAARRMPCAGSRAPEIARRKPCAGNRAPEDACRKRSAGINSELNLSHTYGHYTARISVTKPFSSCELFSRARSLLEMSPRPLAAAPKTGSRPPYAQTQCNLSS